jgi:hypothetical protein
LPSSTVVLARIDASSSTWGGQWGSTAIAC